MAGRQRRYLNSRIREPASTTTIDLVADDDDDEDIPMHPTARMISSPPMASGRRRVRSQPSLRDDWLYSETDDEDVDAEVLEPTRGGRGDGTPLGLEGEDDEDEGEEDQSELVEVDFLSAELFYALFGGQPPPRDEPRMEETPQRPNRKRRASERKVILKKRIRMTEEKECSVCMEPIKPRSMVYDLKCKHRFHPKCLDMWIQSVDAWTGREHNSCPNCRKRLT
jgi:hypothetical protein